MAVAIRIIRALEAVPLVPVPYQRGTATLLDHKPLASRWCHRAGVWRGRVGWGHGHCTAFQAHLQTRIGVTMARIGGKIEVNGGEIEVNRGKMDSFHPVRWVSLSDENLRLSPALTAALRGPMSPEYSSPRTI